MIYKHDIKSHWENQINSIFSDHPKTDMDIFLSVVSLVLDERFDQNISELYSTIHNVEMFTEIINKFSGMTIKIPDRDEFKTALSIALAYHYKEIKKMKWDDIKKELPYGDDIPLKTGKGIAKLQKSIRQQLEQLLQEE
jgi:hypothetical protein